MMTESATDYDVTVSKNVSVESVTAVDPPAERRRKKKSGAFGIFKAALHLMRRRKTHAAKIDLAKPDPNWTKLVGSIRPLRLQETAEIIISPAAAEIGEIIPTKTGEIISPEISSTSHYSSASSLLDLDNCSDEEEDDPDEVFDALTGDELIDAKADEFIAQFYKQLQLQNTAKHHRHAR